MTYTTQMNAARAGIATKEMETVAAYEGMDRSVNILFFASGRYAAEDKPWLLVSAVPCIFPYSLRVPLPPVLR